MAVDTATTIGSVSIQGNAYPVYGTQDRAEEYFAARLGATNWSGAAFIDKGKALVTARRRIDRESFLGEKTVATQLPAFPRGGDTDIPLNVEFAQYELALILLGDATQFERADQSSNIKRVQAGTAAVEFFSPTISIDTTIFPDHIHDLLAPFLASSTDLLTNVASGNNNPNNIIGFGGFGITDGW